METRVLGRTGAVLPIIGQGTWKMENDDHSAAIAALRRGVDLGLTHIDTAELYGAGEVEALVGEALRGRRDEVFLASKVLPQNATYQGTLDACERSLRRLRTDHLDLYLLHWPGAHPLEETLRAFEALRAAGKIGAWGLSNFDVPALEHALRLAGPGRIACDQVLYHLQERYAEDPLMPWCREHGIGVVAYSPFGSGDFPGRETPGRRALDQVAAERRATARQVALAFLLRRPGTFAIPKASRPQHVVDNAAAGDITLTDDEVRRIDEAFPRRGGRRRGGLPVL